MDLDEKSVFRPCAAIALFQIDGLDADAIGVRACPTMLVLTPDLARSRFWPGDLRQVVAREAGHASG